MALGKPVVASNKGGTPEIIGHGAGGYLVQDHDSVEIIASYVIELIDNVEKRVACGSTNRKMIYENFSVERMGRAFERVYQSVISKKADVTHSNLIDAIDQEAVKQ
nr:glycosyltransferase [Pontibacter sp. BAB1700]